MKINLSCKLYSWFYNHECKGELKKRGLSKKVIKAVKKETKDILLRAKDIGNSRLITSYIMGAYFIALNRKTGLTAEENYEILSNSMFNSTIFHKAMGDADHYLDPKKMEGRHKWSEETHKKKYENDWVLDVLDKTEDYDLGYDYLECGVCKLCNDEGCFELAKYLCKMDFGMADMMGMTLKRTTTLAEGGPCCDFRYSKKK